LKRKRICTIQKEVYFKIDYYPMVDGEPILLTMQINGHQKDEGTFNENDPLSCFQIAREVTDEQ
jgi:hypothetical protein